MWWIALATVLLASSADALDVSLEAYRDARRAGSLGVVSGRAYSEPRTARGSTRPIGGTVVTLLPRSEALWAKLEKLKEQSRESSTMFAAAVPAMRKAKEEYERELVQAGAPELAQMIQVDQDGGFRIDDLPAGSWMLLGWHGDPVNVATLRPRSRGRDLYQPRPRVQGYQSVTIWLREITVVPNGTVTVELTDRNGWFRGVAEDTVVDAGR
jgi:hypothetical protein